MDKRSSRVQPIRLKEGYFPLDLHKSMFINDMQITVPVNHVKAWTDISLKLGSKRKWIAQINYKSPKGSKTTNFKYSAELFFTSSKGRSAESNFRLKWKRDFATQLARDYPKSFVRALEYHIGDDYYKSRKYTEYDVGGFKEQVQVKIVWENGEPCVHIMEYFKIREDSQGFPKTFKEISSYLIADYLLGDDNENSRRIRVSGWKPRSEIGKEMKENVLYVLINRNNGELYFGETKRSLSTRYPNYKKHHSIAEWTDYLIIQLPPETRDATRVLVERVLINVGVFLFNRKGLWEDGNNAVSSNFKLKNRKV